MPVEITMPQLSDTMTEGTVVKWVKAEGDKVKEGETIAEIETDKANMEFESEASGTVAIMLVAEGQKAKVGDPIAVVATAKDNVDEVKKQYAGRKAGGGAAAPAAKATEGKKAETSAAPAGKKAEAAPAPKGGSGVGGAPTTTFESASVDEMKEADEVGHGATRSAVAEHGDDEEDDEAGGNGERIRISPLARRIAKERGIDIAQLRGSGPHGRIVKDDVLSFTGAPKAPAPAAKAGPAAAASSLPQRVPTGEKQVIPLTKMRATIGQRLQQAKQQIPHIYVTIDIDMDPVSSLRERVNRQLEAEGVRISIADFVAKAVASALQRHPAVNAHFDEKNNQIIRYGDVHLGSAVALPDGLIVPVLRNVDQMGLKEIRQRSADLFDRAKAQRLKREELSGATFTITNLGQWGVKQFDAVINPPEVGILAVSAAEKRPVVKNGQVVPGTVMTVTLSADHRAVDGAAAAEFLRTLKQLLEEPAMMLV